jgi:hypothetical protein
MKKMTFLLVLLGFAISISAQENVKSPISWGIRAGLDRSYRANLVYHDFDGTTFSEFIGIYARVRRNSTSSVSFQGEFLYKTFSVGKVYYVKTSNFELPVSVRFSPRGNNFFSIYAGFAPVLKLSTEIYFGQKSTTNKRSPNLSYFGGISAQLPFWQNKLGLDLRYCGYLDDNYAFRASSLGGATYTSTNNASTFDFAMTYNFK